jgi:hypothetical protein
MAAQFCPEAEGSAIAISARARGDGVTDVQIDVVTDLDATPCWQPDTPPGREYRNSQPQLPFLAAPAESDFVDGGGRGGPDHWESRGYLYAPLSLDEVAVHYGREFAAAGWTERLHGGDDVVAWSQWSNDTEEGGPTGALLLAVRHLESGGYSLIARATREA